MSEDSLSSLLIWNQNNLGKIQLIYTLVTQAWKEFKDIHGKDKHSIVQWLYHHYADLTIIELLIEKGEFWCSTYPCDPKAPRLRVRNTNEITAVFTRLQELGRHSCHDKIFITLCQHPLANSNPEQGEEKEMTDTTQKNELGILLDWYVEALEKIEHLKKLVETVWNQFYEQNEGKPRTINEFILSRGISQITIIQELINNGIFFYTSQNLRYSEIPYIDIASITNTDEIEAEAKQETQGNSSVVRITIRLKQHPKFSS